MSQPDREATPRSSGSSFPISSPSFWDEAAAVPTPPTAAILKRALADEGIVKEQKYAVGVPVADRDNSSVDVTPIKKRARFVEPNQERDDEDPLRAVTKAEIKEEGENGDGSGIGFGNDEEDETEDYRGNHKTLISAF
jgi:hypothetical protein